MKLHLQSPIPRMTGTIELVMDQAGKGEHMLADDLRFYNEQGLRVSLSSLRIPDLRNPQGPLAAMLGDGGLNLFVEITDLGQITRKASDATLNQRRFADLILRINLNGQITEMKARIYRGGYWRTQRTGNFGTNAFYDGKGRYQDENRKWQIDVGHLVHGPFDIQSGMYNITDETTPNRGPTPVGWYGLWERTDFRTEWDKDGKDRNRPQIDHSSDENGRPYGFLQQGSYCQWAAVGNRVGQDVHGAYQWTGPNPPASVHFKFELVPWGHSISRTNLQLHPDGYNDGTHGCIGTQSYSDCCRTFFLLRHYFGTRLQVEAQ